MKLQSTWLHGFFIGAISVTLGASALGCTEKVIIGNEGGGGSGGGGAGGSTGTISGGIQHAACSLATPDVLPPLPAVNVMANGRPKLDLWRDLGCESSEVNAIELCGDNDGCSGQKLCIDSDGQGVCTYADVDIWCDGEGEVMGYGNGDCWTCLHVEAHAKACCEGLAGFDCRAWPFPADGKPGMVCARHEDCEAGLLCGASRGSGYGICQCPGLDAEGVAPPDLCW